MKYAPVGYIQSKQKFKQGNFIAEIEKCGRALLPESSSPKIVSQGGSQIFIVFFFNSNAT